MSDVVLATLAVSTPMGQQEYETQLAAHLGGAQISVREVAVRSLRSDLSSGPRLPLHALGRMPLSVQHIAARAAYGSAVLVHRCDLRLPAARREVVTVHDLAPLRFSDEGEIPPRAIETLRAARAVICPSQFAADELAALLDIHTAVPIHNGLDPAVFQQDEQAVSRLARFDLPSKFVLHSGGATERKNLAGLAEAWRLVSSRDPNAALVLCGPPDERRTTRFEGLPHVRLLGRVDRASHLALMSAATAVVVPSTYEGFGFPALEAMARGTAVVAADAAALPEICGDAAELATPTGAGLAAGLEAVLLDDARRAALERLGPDHAREFTWERSAAAHAAVYRINIKAK